MCQREIEMCLGLIFSSPHYQQHMLLYHWEGADAVDSFHVL